MTPPAVEPTLRISETPQFLPTVHSKWTVLLIVQHLSYAASGASSNCRPGFPQMQLVRLYVSLPGEWFLSAH